MKIKEFSTLIDNLHQSKNGNVILTARNCNGVKIFKDRDSLVYRSAGIEIRFTEIESVVDGVYLSYMGRAKALLELRHINSLEVL